MFEFCRLVESIKTNRLSVVSEAKIYPQPGIVLI